MADLARRDPHALNVLAPFLTDKQFDEIVRSNLTDDEANGLAAELADDPPEQAGEGSVAM